MKDEYKKRKVENFLRLALKIKKDLETHLGKEIKNDYIYENLLKMIEAVENNTYPPKPRKTDIGVAAMKEYAAPNTDDLCNAICEVNVLYEKLPL